VHGTAKLFSGSKTGWLVQLPQWRYPLVCDTASGKIEFDNYQGHWGEQLQLDRFLQAYAAPSASRPAGSSSKPSAHR
jgi:hypothetical protein